MLMSVVAVDSFTPFSTLIPPAGEVFVFLLFGWGERRNGEETPLCNGDDDECADGDADALPSPPLR